MLRSLLDGVDAVGNLFDVLLDGLASVILGDLKAGRGTLNCAEFLQVFILGLGYFMVLDVVLLQSST